MRRRLESASGLRFLAAAVTVTFALGVIGATTAAGETTDEQVEWDPRVVDLVRFVEDERGLRFDHPVPIELLSESDFVAQLASDIDEVQAELDGDDGSATHRALGVLGGDVSLRDAVETSTLDGVVGLYDSEAKQLRIRGTELTPAVQATVVNELVHALQDQHFDIVGYSVLAEGKDLTYLDAIVEGDAERIAQRWIATYDDTTFDRYITELETEATAATHGQPRVVEEQLAAPYVLGPLWVELLEHYGGRDAVDDAFNAPPQTAEEATDIAAFLDPNPIRSTSGYAPNVGEIVFGSEELGTTGLLML